MGYKSAVGMITACLGSAIMTNVSDCETYCKTKSEAVDVTFSPASFLSTTSAKQPEVSPGVLVLILAERSKRLVYHSVSIKVSIRGVSAKSIPGLGCWLFFSANLYFAILAVNNIPTLL